MYAELIIYNEVPYIICNTYIWTAGYVYTLECVEEYVCIIIEGKGGVRFRVIKVVVETFNDSFWVCFFIIRTLLHAPPLFYVWRNSPADGHMCRAESCMVLSITEFKPSLCCDYITLSPSSFMNDANSLAALNKFVFKEFKFYPRFAGLFLKFQNAE